jgi:hypothetical protein
VFFWLSYHLKGGPAEKLLREHPEINVNSTRGMSTTPLINAAQGELTGLVLLLLERPDTNVNHVGLNNRTALCCACLGKATEIVRALCSDPRVDVNIPDRSGCTPMWLLTDTFNEPSALWFVALRGPDIDLTRRCSVTIIERVSHFNHGGVPVERKLAERLKQLVILLYHDKRVAQHEASLRLKLQPQQTAHLFALVVMTCDGFFKVCIPPRATRSRNYPSRFIRMVCRLPLELQMIVCCRAFGSPLDLVPTVRSEPAFRHIALSCSMPHLLFAGDNKKKK